MTRLRRLFSLASWQVAVPRFNSLHVYLRFLSIANEQSLVHLAPL